MSYQRYIGHLIVVLLLHVFFVWVLEGFAHHNLGSHIYHRHFVDISQVIFHIVLRHFHWNFECDHILGLVMFRPYQFDPKIWQKYPQLWIAFLINWIPSRRHVSRTRCTTKSQFFQLIAMHRGFIKSGFSLKTSCTSKNQSNNKYVTFGTFEVMPDPLMLSKQFRIQTFGGTRTQHPHWTSIRSLRKVNKSALILQLVFTLDLRTEKVLGECFYRTNSLFPTRLWFAVRPSVTCGSRTASVHLSRVDIVNTLATAVTGTLCNYIMERDITSD